KKIDQSSMEVIIEEEQLEEQLEERPSKKIKKSVPKSNADGLYIVKDVIGTKKVGNSFYFEVVWKGFSNNTWEPSKNLKGTVFEKKMKELKDQWYSTEKENIQN